MNKSACLLLRTLPLHDPGFTRGYIYTWQIPGCCSAFTPLSK
jgi:hypothetical protein